MLNRETASKEIIEWVNEKVKKWGIPLTTLWAWLQAKEQMAPDLLEEATSEKRCFSLRPEHYMEVARGLPTKPELQHLVTL